MRLKQLGERKLGILIEHLGVIVRAHQLQELGEELDVDQTAPDVLQIPDVAGALFLVDLGAHGAHVGGHLSPVARPAQHFGNLAAR